MANTRYIKSTLKSLEDKADENWWLENVRKNLDVSDKLAPYQMEMDAELFFTDIPMGRAQGFLDFGTNIIRLDKEFIVIRSVSRQSNSDKIA
jgi:hypothetical protein